MRSIHQVCDFLWKSEISRKGVLRGAFGLRTMYKLVFCWGETWETRDLAEQVSNILENPKSQTWNKDFIQQDCDNLSNYKMS